MKTLRPTPARPRNSLKKPTGKFSSVLCWGWGPLTLPEPLQTTQPVISSAELAKDFKECKHMPMVEPCGTQLYL